MATPLAPPALKSAYKMRRILARSVSFRAPTHDCLTLASHKHRKPKPMADQKESVNPFKTPSLVSGGFPCLTLPKQRSCLVRDALKMYKQERITQGLITRRSQLECRLSTKLPKREVTQIDRFFSEERAPPVSPSQFKPTRFAPLSPSKTERELPSFVLLKRYRPEKDSDILSLTPRTRCSEGSDSKFSSHQYQSEKKLRSRSSAKLTTLDRQRWQVKTRKGHKPMSGTTTNQDSYFYKEELAGLSGVSFMGVCDGHGSVGHLVSKHVSFSLTNFFTTLLRDYLGESRFVKKKQIAESNIGSISQRLQLLIQDEESTDMDQLLKMAFVQTHRALSREDFDCYKSGTSACTVLVAHSTLFCANAGDSRAVLGQKEGMFWKAMPLSRDHKPTEEDERRRIIANNGRVLRISGGSPRIWLQDKLEPGLALSRSLGDKMAHKVGVISAPEVKRHHLSLKDKFIIIGSDGLWDKVSSEEAVKVVGEYMEARKEEMATGALISMAAQRWMEGGTPEHFYMDDITALVTFLQ